MTGLVQLPPTGDGPFGTAEQAQIRYAAFCRAAHARVAGPPGEELVFRPGQLEYETLIDTLETVGVDLGEHDRDVLGRLAAAIGPLAVAVLNSLFQRAAGDGDDPAVYVVARSAERPSLTDASHRGDPDED